MRSVLPQRTGADAILDALNPIGEAWASSFTCTGGQLSPTFNGPGSYQYTPWSCSFTGPDGETVSSVWSTFFTLDYSTSCDATSPSLEHQAGNCARTRTTPTGGNTRTLTGAKGGQYAIDHDTNGQGTGWDSSVSPAPKNSGVVATCDASGCTAGRTVEINGSHLTGTLTPAGGAAKKIWDHTLTTASPLVVTGSGAGRVVNGTLTVQHNLAKYTAQVTFNQVAYTDPLCCFPTGGSVQTAISAGLDQGKTESLSFGPACGQATLKELSGVTSSFTMRHCL
jgi:hypothetical protein